MKTKAAILSMLLIVLAGSVWTGCESTGEGGGSVSGGVYYGVGFYDPWYYGGYHQDIDVIVPPPNRPSRPSPPIATPAPRPTPMPSIPSAPRPSFRR